MGKSANAAIFAFILLMLIAFLSSITGKAQEITAQGPACKRTADGLEPLDQDETWEVLGEIKKFSPNIPSMDKSSILSGLLFDDSYPEIGLTDLALMVVLKDGKSAYLEARKISARSKSGETRYIKTSLMIPFHKGKINGLAHISQVPDGISMCDMDMASVESQIVPVKHAERFRNRFPKEVEAISKAKFSDPNPDYGRFSCPPAKVT